MTETTSTPVRPRRRLRLYFLLGILLLLVAYVAFDAWAGRRLDAEIARVEQMYGSLKGTKGISVPAADNRARVARAAAAMIVLEPGAAFRDFSASLARFNKLGSQAPVPADLRAFVQANQAAIGLADEIRARHRSDFEGNQAPLLDMRTLSSAISLAARLDLEAGRADDATAKIRSGLALCASLRQEPELIAQLIRIAVGQTQFQAVQRVITEAEPSKAALAELALWLAEAGTPDPIHTGLLGELRYGNRAFIDLSSSNPWVGPIARLGRPWIRRARTHYLQQMGHLLAVQTGPRPRPSSWRSPRPPAWAFVERLATASLPGLDRAIETGDDFMNEYGATVVAVALRRYKLDHGVYPDDLAALAPAYLERLPIDAYTGRRLVYSPKGSGFTLRAQAGPDAARAKRPTLEWNVPK